MLNWFDYHGHVCIVFNKFGDSVFEFLVSHCPDDDDEKAYLFVYFSFYLKHSGQDCLVLFSSYSDVFNSFIAYTEKERLSAILSGPSAPHSLSAVQISSV